jgi:excisionase family DNA binding protein
MSNNWLSLSQVADKLGVHPSTVRNWADQGVLPVHRTQGGHRRFQTNEIELWLDSKRSNQSDQTTGMLQNALGFARIQIVEGHLEGEPWYQKLDEAARVVYRKSGRKLMQGLLRSQSEDKEEAKAEARALGRDYAAIGRRYDLTVVEATQAFLYFRNILVEAAFHSYEQAAVQSSYAWGDLLRKINTFTDHILLNLLETYNLYSAKS